MYDNIGTKIKNIAKFFCWIGIVFSVITAIAMFIMADEYYRYEEIYITLGVFCLLLGPLVSWVGSLFVYGFGELLERNCSIDEKLTAQNALIGRLNLTLQQAQSKPAQPPKSTVAPPAPKAPVIVSPAVAETTTTVSPVHTVESETTKEEKPSKAYSEEEKAILKTLLEEGQLSKEEYQKCMDKLKG